MTFKYIDLSSWDILYIDIMSEVIIIKIFAFRFYHTRLLEILKNVPLTHENYR